MKPRRVAGLVLLVVPIISALAQDPAGQPLYGTFAFEMTISVPGSRGEVFNALTGDISAWWDHSFSKNPYRFYIEPKPVQ